MLLVEVEEDIIGGVEGMLAVVRYSSTAFIVTSFLGAIMVMVRSVRCWVN